VNILIVGASGNLGSLLSKHLLPSSHHLRLLTHKRSLPFDLPHGANAEIVQADLNDPASLRTVCDSTDCIVYLAGVLFEPRPETFLHRTNTVYVQNMVSAATAAGVKKFILVSFPHVEENTTPEMPAKGLLNSEPKSLHARTRLDAEKHLFCGCEARSMIPIVLRAQTWLHLLALPDFLNIVQIAIANENLSCIYALATTSRCFYKTFSTGWPVIGIIRSPGVSRTGRITSPQLYVKHSP
jgi:nucleoside-diphosphate-sugar epimerase